LRSVRMTASTEQMLKDFVLQHIGSGKDVDDCLDQQKYGHIIGLNQRHKWGLDPGVGTPLQICAAAGCVDASMILLDAGADINHSLPAHGSKGAPAIMLAIKKGAIALVKLLLERGADRSVKANMLGHGDVDACEYARLCAQSNPNDEERFMISSLVEYYNGSAGPVQRRYAFPNQSDSIPLEGKQPVQYAKELIGTGRDIDDIHGGLKWAQTPDSTPLAVVTAAGDIEAVRFLLAAGANANKLNALFGGPLHFAVKINRADLAKVLLDAGANKDLKTKEPGALSAVEYARQRSGQDPSFSFVASLVEYHTQVWSSPIRPGQ